MCVKLVSLWSLLSLDRSLVSPASNDAGVNSTKLFGLEQVDTLNIVFVPIFLYPVEIVSRFLHV